MTVTIAAVEAKRSRVRIFIVLMLFIVTTVNYADRASLSSAGSALSKELDLDPVALGYVFSAFGWSYVAAQVPGGWLLDRYGSKWVYACSILIWSVFTFMQGAIGFFAGGTAIVLLFALRFLVGLAEAPSFPANARIVAAWFPGNERGTASAFFNSGQYFATVLFAPLMGWIPVSLVKERGLTILQAGFVATLPALCGFFGGVLGGVISDVILRKTNSLTLARKVPIVGGMLLSMAIIGCNYVDGQAFVVGLMALAFFGKGIGALGWAVVSDTSPKEAGGISGGLFNMFGNLSSITTPIIVGYILGATGSFNGALVFVGANALVAAVAYLFVVGKIERVQLPTS